MISGKVLDEIFEDLKAMSNVSDEHMSGILWTINDFLSRVPFDPTLDIEGDLVKILGRVRDQAEDSLTAALFVVGQFARRRAELEKGKNKKKSRREVKK